ncbi:MAG: hypothetical protein JWR10_1714 [Rubritepida sp.]|nr:hypothetical protein [Rubritepida sp.]
MTESSEGPVKGNGPLPQPSKINGRGRKASSDVAFDLWLERGLHKMFDDVASEPIPPELLALIERDRKGS